MKKLLVTAAWLLVMSAQSAMACPVCFGDPSSPLTKGATNAVWFLLAIVGVVQAGFVALFISFWRRARAMRRVREQFHVIHGGMQ